MSSGLTTAKGRRSSNNKNYYSAQKRKTRANKLKRILKSNGKEALAVWLQKNPLLINI